MTYEDFFSPADVATYKRVKLGTMRLGQTAKTIALKMVSGWVYEEEKFKYVHTYCGKYLLVMAHNSLNTVERREAERQHAEVIVMGDDNQLGEWFKLHGLRRAPVKRFRARLKAEFGG